MTLPKDPFMLLSYINTQLRDNFSSLSELAASLGADEEKIIKAHPDIWLSVEERTRQMYKICEDAGKFARIVPSLIDITGLRLPDGSEDWEAETPLVRALLGNRLDAVYSSEESYGEYFSHAYPEAVHRLVDVKRIHYPISGTEIREMESEQDRAQWII